MRQQSIKNITFWLALILVAIAVLPIYIWISDDLETSLSVLKKVSIPFFVIVWRSHQLFYDSKIRKENAYRQRLDQIEISIGQESQKSEFKALLDEKSSLLTKLGIIAKYREAKSLIDKLFNITMIVGASMTIILFFLFNLNK